MDEYRRRSPATVTMLMLVSFAVVAVLLARSRLRRPRDRLQPAEQELGSAARERGHGRAMSCRYS